MTEKERLRRVQQLTEKAAYCAITAQRTRDEGSRVHFTQEHAKAKAQLAELLNKKGF